jgi:hypothetical protein
MKFFFLNKNVYQIFNFSIFFFFFFKKNILIYIETNGTL